MNQGFKLDEEREAVIDNTMCCIVIMVVTNIYLYIYLHSYSTAMVAMNSHIFKALALLSLNE